MRFVLIHNPASGRGGHRRAQQLRQVSLALSALGHRVEVAETTVNSSATTLARNAARGGAEIVFACGGDGTIHEVLQGLVSESGEQASVLGIIPLGSANAFARHLGISLDPLKAALQGINGTALTIPVGKVRWSGQVRYFAVMAGAGPDGALVYDLLAANKRGLGRLAYYLHAARLFATSGFPAFEIEYADAESGNTVTEKAVSAMAVRVSSLGGVFSGLARRGASIYDRRLQLLILRPPAALSLPVWFLTGWLGLRRVNPYLSDVTATTFLCRPLEGLAPHCQADGEWLGRIPMQVSIVPNALRIQVPSQEGTRGV